MILTVVFLIIEAGVEIYCKSIKQYSRNNVKCTQSNPIMSLNQRYTLKNNCKRTLLSPEMHKQNFTFKFHRKTRSYEESCFWRETSKHTKKGPFRKYVTLVGVG